MPSWLGWPATASTWHQMDSGHARAEHLHRALQWVARRPPERDDVHVARSDEDCPKAWPRDYNLSRAWQPGDKQSC